MPTKDVTEFTTYPRSDLCGPLASVDRPTFIRTSTWSNTPGFPDVSPLPFRAYTMDLTKHAIPMTTVQHVQHPNPCKRLFHGDVLTEFGELGVLRAPWLFTDSESKAIASARRKAKDATANWAQMLAEAGKTYNLAISTLETLRRAVKALKRGNLKQVIRTLGLPLGDKRVLRSDPTKPLAQRWLELQYGWKPLYLDLQKSLYDATLRTYLGGPKFRVVGNGRDFNQQVTDWNFAQNVYAETRSFKGTTSFSKCILEFECDSTVLDDLGRMGLTNPVSLAWELVPFSFVVDWFLPIGTFLETLDLSNALVFRRGMLSTIRRQKTVITYQKNRNFSLASGGSFQVSGAETHSKVSFARSVFDLLPAQPYPRIKNPFTPGHFYNALALFRNSFK